MSALKSAHAGLESWLKHISRVHPTEIELGLERSRTVAGRLRVLQPAPHVITVAGTNGKGSVAACLEAGLSGSPHSVGCYTSPHLTRFNERIRIDGKAVPDAEICQALAQVEASRGDISLSYYEFATLAALLLFRRARVNVAVLEVGLGGRLDAVNIVDPMLSIITRIDLDHQQWLGQDRDSIALEKAGILRQGTPFVCGDPDPPASLMAKAETLKCPTLRVGTDFTLYADGIGRWFWKLVKTGGEICGFETTEQPNLLEVNVATAVQSLLVIQLPGLKLNPQQLAATCVSVAVPGRQEWRTDTVTGRTVLLDVAHNPSATASLARTLARSGEFGVDRIRIVLVSMSDKKIQDMAQTLDLYTDIWYVAQVESPRCMPAAQAAELIRNLDSRPQVIQFENVGEAYRDACATARANDLVVVTGSFLSVAAVRHLGRRRQNLLQGRKLGVAGALAVQPQHRIGSDRQTA